MECESMKADYIITEQNVANAVKSIAAWIKYQATKANRKGVVLGLSGGVDCSVVARLCQLSGVKTHLILMPYGDSMKESSKRAMELIEQYGFEYHIVDIKPVVDTMINNLNMILGDDDTNHQNYNLATINLRPRVRMATLYAYAQAKGYFVVGTSNLSEYVTGYFTKFGDNAYDINPIGNFTKKEVYILAKYLKLPTSIISAKPSAELWEGQTDEEELGLKYDDIDRYIIYGTTNNPNVDKKIQQRIDFTDHKRNQTAIYPIYS